MNRRYARQFDSEACDERNNLSGRLVHLLIALGGRFDLLRLHQLFARQLPYWRVLLISTSAWGVAAVMMASFYVARNMLGFSQWWVESIACALGLSVAGMLMTGLARKYGVQKTGKLGVGAKSILASMAVGWVLVGILYGLLMLAPAP